MKTAHKCVDAVAGRLGAQRGGDALGGLDVVGRARGQDVLHAAQVGLRQQRRERGLHVLTAHVRADPDGAAIDRLGLGEGLVAGVAQACRRIEPGLLARHLGEQLIEVEVGRVFDGDAERARKRRAGGRCRLAERLVGGLGQQPAPLVVVEDGKARRHAGLEREALQQPLAEGVDGLHLEAAGRLDGDGEELAGAIALLGRRGPVEQLRRACPRVPRRAR